MTTPITPQLIAKARLQAPEHGGSVFDALAALCGGSSHEFWSELGKAFAYPVLSMEELRALNADFSRISPALAQEHRCAAALDANGITWVIACDPLNTDQIEWAQQQTGKPCKPALARWDDLQAWLRLHEEGLSAMEILKPDAAGVSDSERVEEISLQSIGADSSPVVKLVHSSLYDALTSGASDIHFENSAQGLIIKYRIDGVLIRVAQPTGRELAEQAISRIKVMAELDIAERRVPQDGRFKAVIRGRAVDLRVSIMPGVFGEDAVLRVLDRQNLHDELSGITLDKLGFEPEMLAAIRKLSREPYGMFMVTGPTGSGKTTTLYAAISEINDGHEKIITIEDPVEYQLAGVLQVPVNEKKGLTFSRGLRSILRHDPDKIMVGEIRDTETAQIAVQSALTGHLVFTTVHANTVFDVIGRFVHMGIDPYSFVSALNGILAQRLIRLNCEHCAQPITPSAHELAESGLTTDTAKGFRFMKGMGCGHCRGTGFHGRKAIAELLLLTDEIRDMIGTRAPVGAIKQAAAQAGMQGLRAAALRAVARGETTLDEINRVTFVE